jgi:hypothetical protein
MPTATSPSILASKSQEQVRGRPVRTATSGPDGDGGHHLGRTVGMTASLLGRDGKNGAAGRFSAWDDCRDADPTCRRPVNLRGVGVSRRSSVG